MGFLSDVIGGITGSTAANAAKKSAKAQQQIAKQQQQLFQQASPYYNQILQQMAGYAGLPGTPGIAGGTAANGYQPGPNAAGVRPGFGLNVTPSAQTQATPPAGSMGPALQNSALGIFGSNPADVFRLNQAQEDINRQTNQGANQLAYRLGQHGIGGSTLASALAGNEMQGQNALSNFRRQLAINAGQEQQNRLQQLLAALNPALGGAGTAASIFGNLGAQAGQQAQGAQQNLANLAYLFL